MSHPKLPPQDAALVRSLANLAAQTTCYGKLGTKYSPLQDGYSLGLIAAAKYVAMQAKIRQHAARLAQQPKTYVLDDEAAPDNGPCESGAFSHAAGYHD